MNIELSRQNLFWEMRETVDNHVNGEKIDFNTLNNRMEQLLHGAENCLEMIDNRKNLSDEEFYKKLLEFAYINDWNEYDCFLVLEIAYNMKFDDEALIKTTMHTVAQKTEGHGRDFSWWNQEVGVDFRIFYTKDFEVDYEHYYTIEEIKKLIAEKKILIVSEEERNLAWEEDNYKKEKYQRFDYAYDEYNMEHRFFDETGKFYKYTLKYIRRELNTKKLKKLYFKHLDHLEHEVYEATDGRNYGSDSSWTHVAKEYSKEFEECGYAKRLTRLKKVRNNK